MTSGDLVGVLTSDLYDSSLMSHDLSLAYGLSVNLYSGVEMLSFHSDCHSD